MSFDRLAARARGLGTRSLPEAVGTPRVVETTLRERASAELALLARWDASALVPLELDEDRRTLRALARGLVANIAPSQRVIGAVPTRTLPHRRLGALANASSFAEVRELLGAHPLAPAFDASELFAVELELAKRYFARARLRDRAFAIYIAQLVDVDNAQAALLLAARGGDVTLEDVFLAGGERLDRATFLAACGSLVAARERLSRTFAKTPVATALFAPGPAAVEDAALAWQLATQAHLRRVEPLGLAPVLHFVLRRREEARRLRRAAWSAVLGGAA